MEEITTYARFLCEHHHVVVEKEEWSQTLPPLPEAVITGGGHEDDDHEGAFVQVAYYAACRGLKPPESLLRRVRPVIEAGKSTFAGDERCRDLPGVSAGDHSWNALLQRRRSWISGVLAEAGRVEPARRLILIHGDFELRSDRATLVWNSAAGAAWAGGACFDPEKSDFAEDIASETPRGMAQPLRKGFRQPPKRR